MKNLFVTLAIFLLVLIIGCNERIINEPSENAPMQKNNSVVTNIININEQVVDPLYYLSVLQGKVGYTLQVINRAMNPQGLNEISLTIKMDSELNDMLGMAHLVWLVKGISLEVFYVSEEGILLVQKSYRITNRKDVVLAVEYLVTTNSVRISNISLAQIEGNQ